MDWIVPVAIVANTVLLLGGMIVGGRLLLPMAGGAAVRAKETHAPAAVLSGGRPQIGNVGARPSTTMLHVVSSSASALH
jgi:hypothetical protein